MKSELKLKWQKNKAEGSEIFEAYHSKLVDEWTELTTDLIKLYRGNGRDWTNIKHNLTILLEDTWAYEADKERPTWEGIF